MWRGIEKLGRGGGDILEEIFPPPHPPPPPPQTFPFFETPFPPASDPTPSSSKTFTFIESLFPAFPEAPLKQYFQDKNTLYRKKYQT